jgi:hypothetical protein
MSTGLVWRESGFVEPDFLPDGFGQVYPEDVGQPDEVLEYISQLGFDRGRRAGICIMRAGSPGVSHWKYARSSPVSPAGGHGQVLGSVVALPVPGPGEGPHGGGQVTQAVCWAGADLIH